MKTIKLTRNDASALIELIFRGTAYTDMHYRSSKKMDRIFNLVKKQLEEQGMIYHMNGEMK
jgi:hypothetical protein